MVEAAESEASHVQQPMAPMPESLRIRLQILGAMLVPALALAYWLNAQGFFAQP